MQNQIDSEYRARTRVIVITNSMKRGGAERWVADLALHCKTIRVVAIGIYWQDGELSQEIPRHTPVIFETDKNKLIDKCVHSTGGCDLVLVWDDWDSSYTITKYGVPVLQVSHSGSPLQRKPDRLVNATFLAACNKEAALWFPEKKRDSVSIIYNGANPSRVSPSVTPNEQRLRWGIPPDSPICLYIGRLVEYKGIDRLITQWGDISHHYTRTFNRTPHLVVVGQGYLAEKLRDLAHDSAILDQGVPNICFPKPSSYIGNYLAAANVLMIPSDFEAFPLVWIEGVLARKPIVCTRLPFLDEIESVLPGVTSGTVTPPINWKPVPLGWVNLIHTAINDVKPDAAQSVALDALTTNHMVERWERFIHSCLQVWYAAGMYGETERPNLTPSPPSS